jgi:hypothetical protein
VHSNNKVNSIGFKGLNPTLNFEPGTIQPSYLDA